MANDPAFLFYTGDFSTGTQFFSNEQVGMYIRLLMAQHQHGHLNEKQVKHICGTHDAEVMAKFTTDENGCFFNERLENEITRRKSFSESRRNNRTKKPTSETQVINTSVTYVPHMENENENENETIIKKEKAVVKNFVPPTLSEVIEFFKQNNYPEDLARRMWAGYDSATWLDSQGKKIKNWKQKAHHVWFKKENQSNGNTIEKTGRIGTTELGQFIAGNP